jgi:hypothetical protein
MKDTPVPRYIAQAEAIRDTIAKAEAEASIVKAEEEGEQRLEQQAEKLRDKVAELREILEGTPRVVEWARQDDEKNGLRMERWKLSSWKMCTKALMVLESAKFR